jgi:hypothetical protein
MGRPEREITVTATVRELTADRAILDTVAEQDGKQIIRNATAEIAL